MSDGEDRRHIEPEPYWFERWCEEGLADLVTEDLDGMFDPRGYFVYLLWDGDVTPLYVGQSKNVLARLGNHMGDREKRARVRRVQLVRCDSKQQMDGVERRLIRFFQPPLNRDLRVPSALTRARGVAADV